eukprot:scaffold38817_cov62-Phaeocystis_antarctica.AAC.2
MAGVAIACEASDRRDRRLSAVHTRAVPGAASRTESFGAVVASKAHVAVAAPSCEVACASSPARVRAFDYRRDWSPSAPRLAHAGPLHPAWQAQPPFGSRLPRPEHTSRPVGRPRQRANSNHMRRGEAAQRCESGAAKPQARCVGPGGGAQPEAAVREGATHTLFGPHIHTSSRELRADPPHPSLSPATLQFYSPLAFALMRAKQCHLSLVFVLHLEEGGRGEEAQDEADRHRGLLEQEGERQDLRQRAAERSHEDGEAGRDEDGLLGDLALRLHLVDARGAGGGDAAVVQQEEAEAKACAHAKSGQVAVRSAAPHA